MSSKAHHTATAGQGTGRTPVRSGRAAIRPAVWVVFPWIAGLLVASAWPPSSALALVLAAIIAAAAILFLSIGQRTLAFASLLAVTAALGAARMAIRQDKTAPLERIAQLAGREVVIAGRVASDPRLMDRRWRFTILADNIRAIGTAEAYGLVATGAIPILANVDTAAGVARIGERVQVAGRLRIPRAAAPGLFDYAVWLRRHGIAGTVSAHDRRAFEILPPARPSGLFAGLREQWARGWSALRSYVRRTVIRGLAPSEAGLMAGLILGDRAGLSRAAMTAFQDCGAIHILSVSGLHLGIILVGIGWLLRRLPWPRLWHAPVLIALAWGYVFLVEMNPPVVRAAIMATVFVLSMATARRFDAWNTLALAAVVTLLVAPQAIFDVGFQLSYAAMIGLFWLSAPFRELIPRHLPFLRLRWVWPVRAAVGVAIATAAAQIATWPIIAHHFGRVSLAGMIANLAVIPLVTAAVWGGIATILVGWLPVLVAPVNWLVSWPLKGTLAAADMGASLPFAATWLRPPGWIEVALYVLALWLAWEIGRRRGILAGLVTLLLLVGNLLGWSAWAHRQRDVEIAFIDVGQGDAALCTFPNRAAILIDGGPVSSSYDAGEWTVVPFCRARGIHHLDAIIATHPDDDHIGGLATVIEQLDVGALWYNGDDDSTEVFRRLMDTATRRGVPVQRIAAGDSIIGLGCPARVVGPPRSRPLLDLWPDNDRSITLYLAPFGRTVLFAGDAGALAEAVLLKAGGLRAEVLKVAHHGSAYSTTDPFLDAVHPREAVVSVGTNRYGHPAPVLLRRLAAREILALRTDQAGTLIWHVAADTCWWEATDD